MTPDAKFIEYQDFPDQEPLALFEILNQKHRNYGAKVSARFLWDYGLNVPEYPEYSEWKKQQEKDQ